MRQRLWPALIAVLSPAPAHAQQPPSDSAAPKFTLQEVMIPVRNGVPSAHPLLPPLPLIHSYRPSTTFFSPSSIMFQFFSEWARDSSVRLLSWVKDTRVPLPSRASWMVTR
jgi:hypothetical protein